MGLIKMNITIEKSIWSFSELGLKIFKNLKNNVSSLVSLGVVTILSNK